MLVIVPEKHAILHKEEKKRYSIRIGPESSKLMMIGDDI